MKSIYYNWIKSRNVEESCIKQMIEEEVWGQFVDLETNHHTNNIQPNKKQYNALIKYEPSLSTIQENVVNIPYNKSMIYDGSSSMFILSTSLLLLYVSTQILFKYFILIYGSQ